MELIIFGSIYDLFHGPNWLAAGWSDIENIILLVLKIAFALGGGIAILFIVIGGFRYFMAFGDAQKAELGKKTIISALLGVAVMTLSYFAVGWVWQFVMDDSKAPIPEQLETAPDGSELPSSPISPSVEEKTQDTTKEEGTTEDKAQVEIEEAAPKVEIEESTPANNSGS